MGVSLPLGPFLLPTLLCSSLRFPEVAGCVGHFSASEIASDAPPIASAAELQSHRRVLALGLTERFSRLIKIGCVFQNGGCSEMGFHSRSEHTCTPG